MGAANWCGQTATNTTETGAMTCNAEKVTPTIHACLTQHRCLACSLFDLPLTSLQLTCRERQV